MPLVEHPHKKVIDQKMRELINRLLLERSSLAGIARAALGCEQWRQTYVNQKSAAVASEVRVSAKQRGD